MVETVYLIVKPHDESQNEEVTVVPFQQTFIDVF